MCGDSLRSRFSRLILVGLLVAGSAAFSQRSVRGADRIASDANGTSLVVLVVVDQLRPDLLDRYDEVYTGGLARLRREGLRFGNAVYDHAATETAAGHSTASTGRHPARHGIVANNWRRAASDGSWQTVYSFADTASPILGHSNLPGRSPANLMTDGLADWVQAHDPGARVVSLSGKDRAAIPLAGKTRGEVYWMAPDAGEFVTSQFYRSTYPRWVEEFNRGGVRTHLSRGDSVWESTVPRAALGLARPDTSRLEGDGVNSYFPHRFHLESEDTSAAAVHRWQSRTPMADAALVDFAITAVDELSLGQRSTLDYLAVSFSQTDYIGHDYGPFSREQLDNLIRLDRELGRLLDHLDATVGAGRWVLGLTADHGVLEMPEHRVELGLPGQRVPPRVRTAMVREAQRAAEAAGEDPVAQARAAAAIARGMEWVADAFAWADILDDPPTDTLRALYLNSYYPGRVIGEMGYLGVQVRVTEGTLVRPPTGTTHGSPYLYDRHVPLVLMGGGVTPGVSDRRVSVVDLAPTLARLAGISHPGDLDGTPLFPAPLRDR